MYSVILRFISPHLSSYSLKEFMVTRVLMEEMMNNIFLVRVLVESMMNSVFCMVAPPFF
jgi:hypothetical protein